HGTEQAVDGRALLRTAREVHPAQQRARIHARTREHLGDELIQHLLQGRDLLRKAEDLRAPARFRLLLEALPHALIQAADELIDLAGEELRRLPAEGLLVRK